MRRLHSLAAALALGLPAFAADPLADAVREAVVARKVSDSELKGARDGRTPYRELAADGGVLVGLEVGLAGSPPAERVVAFRPVYLVGGRARSGPSAGSFLSDDLRRTVRLIARDRYAVAAVQTSADRRVDGIAVRFARIERGRLKVADTYTSDWVGAARAENREWLDGNGRLVVGLFARMNGDAVVALGLTFVELPPPADRPATPADAAPTKSAATPGPSILEREAPGPAEQPSILPYVVVGLSVVVPLGLVALLAHLRNGGKLRVWRRRSTVVQLPPAPAWPTAGPGSRPGLARPANRSALADILERDADAWR